MRIGTRSFLMAAVAAAAAPTLSASSSQRPSLRSSPTHKKRRPTNPPTRAIARATPFLRRVEPNPNADIQRLCKIGNLREAIISISSFDRETLCSILQLCAEHRSLSDGHHVHDLIISSGIEVDAVLGSKLVFMYVKCGDMREARRVFDEMPVKSNSYIWNLLMSEYAKAGNFRESLSLFQKMQVLGPNPEVRTFSCLLKCFAALRDCRGGEAIHGCVLKLGFDDDITVGNALIAFYSKCSRISLAIDMFDEMPERVVITWNSIISGCVHNGLSRKGLELFTTMWFSGMDADMATLVSVIPACAELGAGVVAQGKVIHEYLIKAGLAHEINLSNSLINMYSKCGDLGEAVRVFEKMGQRSIVSWTAMISGYTCNGQFEEAMALFGAMESEGIEPDLFMLVHVVGPWTKANISIIKLLEVEWSPVFLLQTHLWLCMQNLLAWKRLDRCLIVRWARISSHGIPG